MAKIPLLGSKNRVSLNAPKASTDPLFRGAQEGARATSALGKGISDLASGANQLNQRLEKTRSESEILEYSDQASRKYRSGLRDIETKAKQQFAGSDHKGYTDFVEKESVALRDGLGKEAPSQDARNFYMRKIEGVTNSSINSAFSDENTNRALFNVNQRVSSIGELSRELQENPDPFRAASEIRLFKQGTKERTALGHWDAKQGTILDGAMVKESRDAVIEGQILHGLPGIVVPGMTETERENAISDFLESEDPRLAPLFEGMSANERASAQRRMMARGSKQQTIRDAETLAMVNGAAVIRSSGDTPTSEQIGQINEATSRVVEINDPNKRLAAQRSLEVADVVGNNMKRIKYLSLEEMGKIDVDTEIITDDIRTAGMDERAKKGIEAEVLRNIKERNADGKAYVEKIMPGLSIQQSLEMQKRLNVSQPRVLTKTAAAQESSAILEAATAEERVDAVDDLVERYGVNTPQAIVEMNKANKSFDKGHLFITYMDNPVSRNTLIKNMGQKTEIEENFKAKFPGVQSTLPSAVETAMDDELSAIRSNGLQSVSNSLRDSVELETKRLMLEKGKDEADAIELAQKTIFDENFYTIGTSDDKSKVIVPKNAPTTKSEVEDVISSELSDNRIERLNISASRYAYPGTQKEFNEVVRDNAFWHTNEAQDGMLLMFYNQKSGFDGPLKDNNGAQVEVKFNRIKEFLEEGTAELEADREARFKAGLSGRD